MRYLLDTNIVIAAMKGRAAVVARLETTPLIDVILSAVVLGELEFGTEKSDITRSVITKLSQVGSDNSCRVEDYTTDAQGNWVTTTSFFTTGFVAPPKEL